MDFKVPMSRLAHRLRAWADRLDPDGTPRLTGLSLTLEQGTGWCLRRDRRGMRVAYLGHAEYDRAHTEADNPPTRIDWSTGATYPPGTSLRAGRTRSTRPQSRGLTWRAPVRRRDQRGFLGDGFEGFAAAIAIATGVALVLVYVLAQRY